MNLSEADRADLYNGLSDVLGARRAEMLMGVLPMEGLAEFPTKTDMRALRVDLDGQMAELRAEMREGFASLRVEMTTEIGALRKSMTAWLITILVTMLGSMSAVVVAVS